MTLVAELALRAVIFDFDHTLVELGRWVDWQAAVRRIVELYRRSGVETDRVGARTGFAMIRELDRALGRINPPVAAIARAQAYHALADEEIRGAERAHLMPGASRMLGRLERAGLTLAIVSSNATDAIASCLERLGLARCFAAVVGRSPKLALKPDPAMFAHCLALLHLAPARVVAVGDSASDIAPAVALAMPAVGVAAGEASAQTLREAGASFVVGDLDELAVLLTGSERTSEQKFR